MRLIMSTILEVIQLRAIELTAILVLGSMVAGLVTYIIRDLKGRYEKMAPKLQDQDSRISRLEGQLANERREITVIIDLMDRRFGAIENRYDAVQSNFNQLTADINVIKGQFADMKRETSELRVDLRGARDRINRED